MTYEDARNRLWCLPGTPHEKVVETLNQRAAEVLAAWKVAKAALTRAEDDVVEMSEIKRAVEQGDGN